MATAELLPLHDLIAKCNRCGFCQAGCPVFRVTGEEHSLSRGRLAIARGLMLGQLDLTPEVVRALDDCLLCRGCTAHCFPALKTDEVVTTIRHAYINRHGQPMWQRILFRSILSDSQRLESAGRMALWAKRTGLATLAEKTGVLDLVDRRLSAANRVVPTLPGKAFLRGEAGRAPAPAKTKHRVGYFVSCGFSFQFPEVVEATLRVLAHNGCAMTVLDNTCCGRPAQAYGDLQAARDIARKNVDRLAPCMGLDAIVSECGSCSTHLKDYGSLLMGDPAYAEKAEAFSRKIQSFSEFLVAVGANGSMGKLEGTVTYHDPCHLSNRFAKVTAQPRKLLKAIPGISYKELPEADWCCGAAGSYTFLHHAEAVGVLGRKMGNVEKTGAAVLATECPACMMHLAYGARRRGLPVQVRHVSQLLDQAYTT
ncbi:MAG TPA: (Fe-S)-binding protein, partial [Candidatus Methylomirabilis sp.]|nr:(Fe-S)-binding protein [Candidatus Methylomirabilis sp.]